jgi:uncharacterized protein
MLMTLVSVIEIAIWLTRLHHIAVFQVPSGDMSLFTIALLLVVGLIAGGAAGLLGVGGGIIMVPALRFLAEPLGLPPEHVMHVAAASSTAVIVPTALRSALAHHKKGALDFGILKQWSGPAAIAGLLAGAVSRWIPTEALALLFAAVAALVGINLASGWLERHAAWPWPGRARARLYAGMLGAVAAWMGIGGGTIGYPLMTAHGVLAHRAVGTSAALGLAISAPALLGWIIGGWGILGLGPWQLGFVSWPIFLCLLLPSLLAVPYGAALAHRLPAHRLSRFFGLFLIASALGLAAKHL